MVFISKLHVILRTAFGFPDDERFWPASQIGMWLAGCTLMFLVGLAYRGLVPQVIGNAVIENLRPIAFVLFLTLYGGSILAVRKPSAYLNAEAWFDRQCEQRRKIMQIALPAFGIVSFLAAIAWFVSAL